MSKTAYFDHIHAGHSKDTHLSDSSEALCEAIMQRQAGLRALLEMSIRVIEEESVRGHETYLKL